jgi:hypothetical protein
MPQNPYRGLEDYRFWSRAVTSVAPGQLDPMIRGKYIAPGERVVTMGSCFAQHLARNLAGLGLNYHIAEAAPEGMPEDEARRRNYGVFSARYGNIYTVRQAVQLYERAFGHFTPTDDAWEADGGFVDAFRPQIEAAPHPTAADVCAAAQAHLACVRKMFQTADCLIFTLGLTEGWRSVQDGAVYPLAPGVSGGSHDPGKYEFVNFTAEEVKRDLIRFIDYLHETNPTCRVILTVSPVPLIATYEDRHVWTATTYSKSVLRVAADEVERLYPHVTYFPSYEIITSPSAGGAYYDDDLRSVTDIGVKHVMRVFRKHFVAAGAVEPQKPAIMPPAPTSDASGPTDVICDEEVIEKSIQASGVGGARLPVPLRQPDPVAPIAPLVAPPLAPPVSPTPAWEFLRAGDAAADETHDSKAKKPASFFQRLCKRAFSP